MPLRAAACLVALLLLARGVSAAAVEPVTFRSLDGTALHALLLRAPAQPAPGTVIALHGCGGLYATSGPRKGLLNARHQAMADLLTADGYNVLLPDSLNSRGESEICTQRLADRRIDSTQRRADALAAVTWVAVQPWSRPDRIALLGWSHGGSAVLSATDRNNVQVAAQQVRPALAIAFYPGCGAALRAGYGPGTRLVMMLGEKDDWTPPAPCIELGRNVGAEVNVFADSYHDFDNPAGVLRVRRDVPNGVNPRQGVHVGPNLLAREASYGRVRQLLRDAFER